VRPCGHHTNVSTIPEKKATQPHFFAIGFAFSWRRRFCSVALAVFASAAGFSSSQHESSPHFSTVFALSAAGGRFHGSAETKRGGGEQGEEREQFFMGKGGTW